MNLTQLQHMQYDYSRNSSVQTVSLTSTSVYIVHSNVYGLGNIHWVRYLTAVDPFHSTFSAVHIHHHVTSGYVDVCLLVWWCINNHPGSTGNSSSIGKVPVSQCWHSPSKITCATSTLVCSAEQGIIIFTNVLQGHTTVVLVCCTIEWEPDITCTWEYHNVPFVYITKFVKLLK